MGGPVRGRREAEGPAERRRERAHAPEADEQADVRDGAVGVAEEGRSPLEPPGEEIPVRCLAERPLELAAEVRGGEAGRAGERADVQRFSVAGVDEVLGAEQVADGRDRREREHDQLVMRWPRT